MVWTSFVSAKCQSLLKKLFGWIGLHAHTYPFTYIAIGVIITVASSFGMMNFSFESNGLHLYIPQTSEIYKQYLRTIDNFGEFATDGIVLVHQKNNENLLTPETLDAIFTVYENMSYDLSAVDSNVLWKYENLCEREFPTYPNCISRESNLFWLWMDQPAGWNTQQLINDAINTTVGQELLPFLMGDLEYGNGIVKGGSYLRLVWFLTGTTNDTIYDANYAWMEQFQEYWTDNGKSYEKSDDLEIHFFTSRSIEDEIGRVVASDSQVYLMAIITMFVYLAFTLGNFTCLGARPWLAVVTVLVMIMALITCYGIGSALGYPMTSLVFLIPYLLLGVGVDDEIIIVEAVDRTEYYNGDPTKGGERFEHALQHSGLSITLTSFCSVMAFAVGSNVDMPGVESFCVYAALGFFANYVLQFLIFLPILAMDEQRKLARRNFCCCCIKHAASEAPSSTNPDGTEVDDSEKFSFGVSKILEKGLLPILSNPIARIVVILLFIGLLVGSIASFDYLDASSDLTRLVPDDSFVIEYFDQFRDAFGSSTFAELQIILEDLDFHDTTVRANIHAMIDEYEQFSTDDANIVGSVDNWLDSFENYTTVALGLDIDSLSSEEFYSHLKSFANSSVNQRWNDEIIYDNPDAPTQIKATKFYMDFVVPESNRETWPVRNKLNKIIKENLGSDDNGYVYEFTFPFGYFEFTVVILTIRNIISASIGVLVILLLLMDLRMAIFIIIIVVMIDFGLFGWIVLTGLSLDSLAFLQLVMAVGLTVDYVIHITHAIADARVPLPDGTGFDDNDFNGKLRIAMLDMGVGVTKGAWTTFLGAIPLVFSQSEAFRRFFYLFAGIIIIALAHGLLFVPAVMANLKFLYSGIEHASHEADKKVEKPNYDPQDIRDEMVAATQNSGKSEGNGEKDTKETKTETKDTNSKTEPLNTSGTDAEAQLATGKTADAGAGTSEIEMK